jgi:hypothetical protein
MVAARFNPNPLVVGALLSAGADRKLVSGERKTAGDYGAANPGLKGTTELLQLRLTAP